MVHAALSEAATEHDMLAGTETLDLSHHPLGFQRGGFERAGGFADRP